MDRPRGLSTPTDRVRDQFGGTSTLTRSVTSFRDRHASCAGSSAEANFCADGRRGGSRGRHRRDRRTGYRVLGNSLVGEMASGRYSATVRSLLGSKLILLRCGSDGLCLCRVLACAWMGGLANAPRIRSQGRRSSIFGIAPRQSGARPIRSCPVRGDLCAVGNGRAARADLSLCGVR